MITLYGSPRTRALRVSWLMEEIGLDWQYQPIDFSKGQHKSPEFLKINPCGKVPALTDGDLTLIESAGICMYLAQKYASHWLPEPGSAESGTHFQWLSYIIAELEQPLWTMAKHKFALSQDLRVSQVQATAKWEFDKAAEVAEGLLPDSEFLCGQNPSVADILLTHTLNWAVKFEQKLPEKLEAYRQRLSARPALRRALDKEIAAAE